MPDIVTTTVQIDPGVQTMYDKTLLRTPFPKYIHGKFAEKHQLKPGQGRTIKMRRYNRLSAVTTPITEGIPPGGRRLSKVDIEATVEQYGDVVALTDVVLLTTPDKLILKTVKLQSDQLHNTNDVLARDVLGASATSLTCSNGTPTGTFLNKTDIDLVVQTMYGNNADYMTTLIKAGKGQGTSPIPAGYVGIAHSDLMDDLDRVSGVKGSHLYASQGLIDPTEHCATGKVRWLLSTQGYTSGSNYHCPIMAKSAYGSVDIEGGNAESIITPPGGHGDELKQVTSVGWKEWQVFRLLQDLFIMNLICTNR